MSAKSEKRILNTTLGPPAKGPYSTVTFFSGLAFVSGQGPISPQTGEVVGEDTEAQTRQVIANIDTILKEAGLAKEDLLKTTIYLTDMKEFSLVNRIYSEWLGGNFPARTCVEVSGLPLGIRVEIDAIAAVPARPCSC